ncbi:hypothetical protein T8K17_03910 [Thalassobaculum sp. OXR-137]|uniref:hypothetical protein n=1 Tax=Thalassobaculum sp. OXR-137 TaxID=3100173 RepID=UPI002AC92270|nr:hypothetical protein [Thalassobaculum sp. OXR-137]WPZ35292.1 hypothetical protein T8K17_03910 [Thalassobaculum sp. OXR-137]
MPNDRPTLSLRRVLYLDAATCLALGAGLVTAAPTLAGLTDIPSALLTYAGAALIPLALVIAAIGRWMLGSPAVWLVILGNAAWVAGSLALVGGAISPNLLGAAFILVQAAAVCGLTWLELTAYRAMGRA